MPKGKHNVILSLKLGQEGKAIGIHGLSYIPDEVKGMLEVVVSSYEVNKYSTVTINLRRFGDSSEAITITDNGAAISKINYVGLDHLITFEEG